MELGARDARRRGGSDPKNESCPGRRRRRHERAGRRRPEPWRRHEHVRDGDDHRGRTRRVRVRAFHGPAGYERHIGAAIVAGGAKTRFRRLRCRRTGVGPSRRRVCGRGAVMSMTRCHRRSWKWRRFPNRRVLNVVHGRLEAERHTRGEHRRRSGERDRRRETGQPFGPRPHSTSIPEQGAGPRWSISRKSGCRCPRLALKDIACQRTSRRRNSLLPLV